MIDELEQVHSQGDIIQQQVQQAQTASGGPAGVTTTTVQANDQPVVRITGTAAEVATAQQAALATATDNTRAAPIVLGANGQAAPMPTNIPPEMRDKLAGVLGGMGKITGQAQIVPMEQSGLHDRQTQIDGGIDGPEIGGSGINR